MNYNDFDWGDTDKAYIDLFTEENFVERTYERLYKVKENDVVLDVGANCGSFSYSIKDVNPKHIYCVEPSNKIFNSLKKNMSGIPSTLINKGIAATDAENVELVDGTNFIYEHDKETFNTISFKTLIEENDIKKINFLKFDCEGGEFHIFTKENAPIIKKIVKNIAGEYHIVGIPNSIESFMEFRDTYLAPLRGTENLRVFERAGREVTEEIFDDGFLHAFEEWWRIHNPFQGQFMVYAKFSEDDEEVLESIPVIGTAVVNSSFWVSRLLMSVDFPVDNFVIINNNGRGELDDDLNSLVKIKHKYIKNIKVVHMPANIGCAGAWNLIIKCYMNSPYWIITNDDVAFNPGLLEEMHTIMATNKSVGTVHPNAGDFEVGAWDLFAIHERAVKVLGLFDENTYPAYCEDADYIMRMVNKGIKKVVGLNHTYLHGTGEAKDYYTHGRQTEKSDEKLKSVLYLANELNIEYLTRKWGPGWRHVSPQHLPFATEEKDISYSLYDLDFVRKKYTGF